MANKIVINEDTNVVNTDGQSNVIKVISEGIQGAAGSTTFSALTDTPANFVADKILKVNSAADAIEYADNINVTNLSYTASTRVLASDTGSNATLPLVTTTNPGLLSASDKSKLDGIEANSKDDQTGSEIKSLYEAESDTNAFSDAEKNKLSGIEANATADQTNAEIKTAYEANSDTNAFTDAEKNKLTGIEASATADQTASEIRTLVESASDSNVFTDADHTKLNGIESSATADQTDAEIKTAYENNSDTNAFTDTEKSKLAAIEASADVTDTSNVDAAGAVMNTDTTTAAMSFVVDEDNMASNSATKVPTQQSVKAYVDANSSDTTYTAGTGLSLSGTTFNVDQIALTTVQTAANESAQLALTTQEGDIVVRSDQNKSYVRNSGTAGTMADFTELLTPTDQVLSVNGNTGAITAAQIAAAVEAASDSNTFTDADHSKLNGIENNATADQTATEIKTAYESNSNTNAYTDAEQTKLSGIEASATADQTDAEIKTAYENNSDTNAFTDAEKNKLSGIAAGAEVNVNADWNSSSGDSQILNKPTIPTNNNELTNGAGYTTNSGTITGVSGNAPITSTGGTTPAIGISAATTSAAGSMSAADKTKLDAIENAATADQTGSEIKSLYEGESDTNAYTDAEKTKLSGIEASADVTDATNVDAAGAVMNSDLDGKGELLVGDGSGDPTALAAGTNGYVLKANSSTATGLEWSAAGTSGDVNQNAFSNVAVSGQDTVAADSTTDTLNIAAGSNVTITTNASNDTVTIASTDTNTTYSVGDGGLTQNNFTNTLKNKLDGIEESATADQTAAEIRTLVESASDSNVFTDADHTKLDGIEASATADQTASEIKTLLQSDKLTVNEIADDAVTADKLANSINTEIAANTAKVTNATHTGDVTGSTALTIANDAVTTDKINLISTSSVPSLEAKGDGTSDGYIQLNCSQNSHGVKIKSPPHSANASYTLTLPNTDGNAGQVLKSDGSGGLDWVDQTAAYTNASVDSHLNTSSASSGEVLSWNGSDYDWVAQSSGGGGGISNLVEDTTPELGGNLSMGSNNISGTGTVIAASTAVATAGMRKIHASTSAPTGSDGAIGDLWVKY